MTDLEIRTGNGRVTLEQNTEDAGCVLAVNGIDMVAVLMHRERGTDRDVLTVGTWDDDGEFLPLAIYSPTGTRWSPEQSVIREAATRMLHGEDYDSPSESLPLLADALGVDRDDVAGIA